ncbi:hypothetical protein U9M48_038524 [Paspalum notatum var. saurae]|uniref:Uncharacterized protein n=1 Tax=Paspalum notatum var. saurae TaxID=547442 RepID=A0AAQ3UI54_PASNO
MSPARSRMRASKAGPALSGRPSGVGRRRAFFDESASRAEIERGEKRAAEEQVLRSPPGGGQAHAAHRFVPINA